VGSLVFGGGHVVLPLLRAEVVPSGWIGNDAFLAGYGAAQAVPDRCHIRCLSRRCHRRLEDRRPLPRRDFLPSFLLVNRNPAVLGESPAADGDPAALRGVNAAVVGLLLRGLYDPIWTSGILSESRFRHCVLRFPAAVPVADAAVARCRPVCGSRRDSDGDLTQSWVPTDLATAVNSIVQQPRRSWRDHFREATTCQKRPTVQPFEGTRTRSAAPGPPSQRSSSIITGSGPASNGVPQVALPYLASYAQYGFLGVPHFSYPYLNQRIRDRLFAEGRTPVGFAIAASAASIRLSCSA